MKFIVNGGDLFRYFTLAVALLLFHGIATVSTLCDGDDSWDCDNGECIDSEYLCDGIPHCRDGSDERASTCINYDCPTYAFRCAYGACVSGTARCNNVKDCNDNSDEMPMLCGSDEERENLELELHGKCSPSKFECKSGQCIDNDLICDGRLDCDDSSDETAELCAATSCPQYSFRCGYGACINGNSTCNGAIECGDSSDEAWSLCGTERKRPKIYTTTPMPPVVYRDRCMISLDRKNMIGTGLFNKTTYGPGRNVPVDEYILFSCKRGFYLIGDEVNTCIDGRWKHDLPYCSKLCKTEDILGYSTQANCYTDYQLTCRTLEPDTEVTLSCAINYREPKNFQKKLKCSSDGIWNAKRVPCEAECGRVLAPSLAFVAYGSKASATDVPWHVGIYSLIVKNEIRYTCGGTIISPTIVISAAHCFWDDTVPQQYDHKLFNVVAGQYHRDYHKNPQQRGSHLERNIKQVFIRDYQNKNNYFKNDLAIVLLDENLRFSEYISPACLHLNTILEIDEVKTDEVGRFAGWGVTEDREASDDLRVAEIKTLSHNDCKRYLSEKDKNYVLPDTHFCIYDYHGTSACRGDSGGGFVIRRLDANGRPYYQLIGVISHSPLKEDDCAREGVVALTHISKLKNFIAQYVNAELQKE